MDGNAADLKAECDAYERKITEAGGIELFVGGIGPDGRALRHQHPGRLGRRNRAFRRERKAGLQRPGSSPGRI